MARKKSKGKEREQGEVGLENKSSPFFTDNYFRNKTLFVHIILHVLLNYSYIAIFNSICKCTVQNVCWKMKKSSVNQARWV